MTSAIAIATLILGVGIAVAWWNLAPTSPCPSSDKAWRSFASSGTPNDSSYTFHPHAIVTSDGTALAADVYVPAWWNPARSSPLPTIVHFTRYNRAYKVRWPFTLFFGNQVNTRSRRLVATLIPHGYVVVTIDVRGTGASRGTRPVDFSPREIADYRDVVEWTLAQPWCDGNVGTGGISYDGMVGLHLAAATDRVKAVATEFSPLDIYDDVALPGGLPCIGFARDYRYVTIALETNAPLQGVRMVPWWTHLTRLLFDGVMPMNGIAMDDVERDHAKNWNSSAVFNEVRYRDDVIADTGLTSDALAVNDSVLERVRSNGAAVYFYAGYFDTASVRGSLRAFDLLGGGKTRVTIGPWTHGGRKNSSPFSADSRVCYDFAQDERRFFDYHLKGKDESGFGSEKPIQYFTMGEEKWKSTDRWPPSVVTATKTYYLADHHLLHTESSSDDVAIDVYDVDVRSSSGYVSRWNLVQHVFLESVTYPDRAQQDKALLVYTSRPLSSSIVVTGVVRVQVFIEAVDATDLVVFGYLEDVDPHNGTVRYVSEGRLRVSHRCDNSSASSACRRSFKRADWRPVSGVEAVELELEPVSYRFGVGHAVQLALSGSDDDNFELSGFDVPRRWKLYRGGAYDSRLALPVE